MNFIITEQTILSDLHIVYTELKSYTKYREKKKLKHLNLYNNIICRKNNNNNN